MSVWQCQGCKNQGEQKLFECYLCDLFMIERFAWLELFEWLGCIVMLVVTEPTISKSLEQLLCYGHSYFILKLFSSRSLKDSSSKAQRPSFWFCLRTKNLFQMTFLNDYSSNIVLTRVTSDLSIFKSFPKIISLKTRFTKWITLILVWPSKNISKGAFKQFGLFESKMEWSVFTSIFQNNDHSPFSWKLPLFSKYFRISYLYFVK